MEVRYSVTPFDEKQAQRLLEAGASDLVLGIERLTLRSPGYFSREEMRNITAQAHGAEATVTVRCNALLDEGGVGLFRKELSFLEEIGVDRLLLLDMGAIHIWRTSGCRIPFYVDGETVLTSAEQCRFFTRIGAQGAILSRELTEKEISRIKEGCDANIMVQAFGHTCLHHSKRKLLTIHGTNSKTRIREAKTGKSYPVEENAMGTHVYSAEVLLLDDRRFEELGIEELLLDGNAMDREEYEYLICKILRHELLAEDLQTSGMDFGTGFFGREETVR